MCRMYVSNVSFDTIEWFGLMRRLFAIFINWSSREVQKKWEKRKKNRTEPNRTEQANKSNSKNQNKQ